MKRKHNAGGRAKRKKSTSKYVAWLHRHGVVFILVGLLFGVIAATQIRTLLVSNKPAALPGWIIEGDQLQKLLHFTPSTLPKTYFDTKQTIVLKNVADPGTLIPVGWASQPGNHYTSFTQTACYTKCYSLQKDIAAQRLQTGQKPVAMYDDEHWGRTPGSEQINPCSAMDNFTRGAHQQGLTTIMAPDQDLAEPGLITSYQGGESENWQSYLRLGLATCAAQTGSEWYHVMSQPFEAHWCVKPAGHCQSSESDFVNFVTQAALQAKSVNPNIKISDGLSTNPQYFGYFRGAATLAKVMYRDYADVEHVVDSVWLNVVGRNANTTTLYLLSMLDQHADTSRRSSVLFLQADKSIQNTQPNSNIPHSFPLSQTGSTMMFVSAQKLSGGTSIPAGTGEFQFWTDGAKGKSAKVNVNFGYCEQSGCTHRSTIKDMDMTVRSGNKGQVTPDGAFTTKVNTTLPKRGTYRLYVQITVEGSSSFNLNYGSYSTPTNLSTPALLPLK
jgi:hypothetical protein